MSNPRTLGEAVVEDWERWHDRFAPPPPILRVMPLCSAARLPTRANPQDAGLDLSAAESLTLLPGGLAPIGTGLTMEIPAGHVGLIAGRSGLARRGVGVLGGVIDPGYSGEVRVILANHSAIPVEFEAGARIAQLLLIPVTHAVVAFASSLAPSVRGSNGFGSSGP